MVIPNVKVFETMSLSTVDSILSPWFQHNVLLQYVVLQYYRSFGQLVTVRKKRQASGTVLVRLVFHVHLLAELNVPAQSILNLLALIVYDYCRMWCNSSVERVCKEMLSNIKWQSNWSFTTCLPFKTAHRARIAYLQIEERPREN